MLASWVIKPNKTTLR